MIITKTEQFHKQFLYDLANLVIFKNEYLDSIKKWDREGKLLSIKYGNQPSKNVKFFGSYFDKKEGSDVTDIDVILLINSVKDERFYKRLPNIFENLSNTSFKFVRFYCGYIEGLEPPWTIGESGDCKFNVQKLEDWLIFLKNNYPDIYEKVLPLLGKDTISMSDLIKANKILEPLISLTWTKEEIIQGFKIFRGVKYSLRTVMEVYDRHRVMKFLYTYQGKYCLIDLNIVAKDNSIPRSSKDPLSYYTGDIYKKFKYLKKMLKSGKTDEYMKERKEAIGEITPLAAFVDLIGRINKYDIVSQEKIQEMTMYAREYSIKHNIETIDYKKLQEMILEKITPLYEKYKQYIKDQNKAEIYIYEIRRKQLDEQVPKFVLEERQKNDYDCPLFPVNIKHIEFLYRKARDSLLDPYKLYDCIYDSWEKASLFTPLSLPWTIQNIFADGSYVIKKESTNSKYILYLDNKEIKRSSRLKKLQKRFFTGVK